MDNKYLNNVKYSLRSRLILTVWFALFLYIDPGVIRLISQGLRSQDAWVCLIVSWVVGTIWYMQACFGLIKYPNGKNNERLTSLGLPNHLTIFRGFLIAIIAGLIVIPLPVSPITWLPGSLFLGAILIDGFDGIVARKSGRTTSLGEFLDMEMDSITVLVGSIAVFIYGKADTLILLVGAARYLFVGGLWLRKKLGRPVNPLRQKSIRRALAGLMMGFLAASLFPVFYPPAIKIVSYFIILPFLLNFLDDWFAVSGFEIPSREAVLTFAENGLRIINGWLLPGLRIFIFSLWLIISVQANQVSNLPTTTIWILFFLSIALLTGTAGRLSAVGLVLLVSMETNVDSFFIPILLILAGSSLILLLGTGRFSFWKPEEFFIFHRVGEHDQS